MSAIENINNNNTRMLMPRPNAQNVQAVDAKIAHIDKEINIRKKYIDTLDNHIKLTKENINLRKEYIQTLQESKELDKKRITLLQESKEIGREKINLLYQLLENRNSRRESLSSVVEIKTVDIKNLDKQLYILAKKEGVLKEQAIAVDTKVEKLATKVEYAEKQIATLQAKSNDTEVSRSQVKQDNIVFARGYKPTDNQIAKLELSKIKQDVQDIKDLDVILQQRAINSQKNIYESIMSKVITDKLTKLL